MDIKKKTMKRDEWPNKNFKQVVINPENINGKKAFVGLIWWQEGIDRVEVNNKSLLIVDKNFTWLQIAIEDQSYWITSMYDDSDNFIEAYFDLNSKNILDEENPYFYDMFTDIIISKDHSVHILDEDELLKAYKDETISKDTYDHIKKLTKELYDYITLNVEEILKYLDIKHLEYKEKIKESMI